MKPERCRDSDGRVRVDTDWGFDVTLVGRTDGNNFTLTISGLYPVEMGLVQIIEEADRRGHVVLSDCWQVSVERDEMLIEYRYEPVSEAK